MGDGQVLGRLAGGGSDHGAKFALTVVSNEAGRQALTRLDYAGAQSWFENNLRFNWFEPWIAHYNVGVALYHQENWWAAENQFQTALPLAPDPKKCTVAMNLAWTMEAKGDSLRARGDGPSATLAWNGAKEVLKRQRCDDSGERAAQEETQERLEDKLDQQSRDRDEQQESEQKPDQEPQDQLAEANRAAQELQQQQRDEMSREGPAGEQRNW